MCLYCTPTVPRRKVQRKVQRRKGPRRKVPRKKVPRRKVKERIEKKKTNKSGVSLFLSLSRNCWLKYRFSPVLQSEIFCFVSAIRFCPCCVPTVPRKRVGRIEVNLGSPLPVKLCNNQIVVVYFLSFFSSAWIWHVNLIFWRWHNNFTFIADSAVSNFPDKFPMDRT